MRPVRTAARAMLAGIFVASGAQTLANPDPLVPRAKRVTERVEPVLNRVNERVPSDPRTLVRFNAGVQLAAGLLLFTPLRRPAALALAGTLVPTTLAGHPFWEDQDPVQRRQQQTHFLKNVGLFGGLLLAASDTEGRPGLRWRARHAAHDANRAVRRTAKQLYR
jgi:putative oxidoreductase